MYFFGWCYIFNIFFKLRLEMGPEVFKRIKVIVFKLLLCLPGDVFWTIILLKGLFTLRHPTFQSFSPLPHP